jgi:hypothetical protein
MDIERSCWSLTPAPRARPRRARTGHPRTPAGSQARTPPPPRAGASGWLVVTRQHSRPVPADVWTQWRTTDPVKLLALAPECLGLSDTLQQLRFPRRLSCESGSRRSVCGSTTTRAASGRGGMRNGDISHVSHPTSGEKPSAADQRSQRLCLAHKVPGLCVRQPPRAAGKSASRPRCS